MDLIKRISDLEQHMDRDRGRQLAREGAEHCQTVHGSGCVFVPECEDCLRIAEGLLLAGGLDPDVLAYAIENFDDLPPASKIIQPVIATLVKRAKSKLSVWDQEE